MYAFFDGHPKRKTVYLLGALRSVEVQNFSLLFPSSLAQHLRTFKYFWCSLVSFQPVANAILQYNIL